MKPRPYRIEILRTVAAMTALAILSSCATAPRATTPRATLDRNDLSKMRTLAISITGRSSYTAYVADTAVTREFGLMNVTEEELPADRGMIFVFDQDRLLSFWMHNTIIPLDIAYIRSDGTIVKTHTMQPLDERGYPSIEPARFALEVRAGQFAQWGIRAGDHVELPAELLN